MAATEETSAAAAAGGGESCASALAPVADAAVALEVQEESPIISLAGFWPEEEEETQLVVPLKSGWAGLRGRQFTVVSRPADVWDRPPRVETYNLRAEVLELHRYNLRLERDPPLRLPELVLPLWQLPPSAEHAAIAQIMATRQARLAVDLEELLALCGIKDDTSRPLSQAQVDRWCLKDPKS